MKSPLIRIYTQAYNTKSFLPRCIESVLNQTFKDFEYVLIDNASTDGSRELMEQYAAQDERIKLIRLSENHPGIWSTYAREIGGEKYLTNLDSDDWLELNFLERLLELAEVNNLDIVCTGTTFHTEEQEEIIVGTRSLPQQMCFDRTKFPDYFAYYHAFFRTAWGKLIRRDVFLKADDSLFRREGILNGADTLTAFAWLRQARRICVDNSILHHYLVRRKSISRVYLPNRFKSNTVLHQDAVDFLSWYGPVSRENLHFLHIIYANAVFDTLEVLWGSDLTPEEKLAEYCAIALHPTTVETYQDADEAIERSRNALLQQMLATAQKAANAPQTLPQALQVIRPQCGQVLTAASLPLFQREPVLLEALYRDDWDGLVENLMRFITEKRYTKQFDLGGLLNCLIPSQNPLKSVQDVRFFRRYTEISMLLLCENYQAALECMTERLLSGQKLALEEVFYPLYLALASLQRQEAAFLFGKIRQAEFFLRQGRREEAAAVLQELEGMGMEENPELAQLRSRLKEGV